MQEINDKTILWDEQIERFLGKQMNVEEEQQFLNQVNADNEMKDYVASATLLISKLRKQGEKEDLAFVRAAKNSSKKDVYAAMGKKRPTAIIVKMSPIFAIAACACFFFGNSYLLKSSAIDFAEGSGVEQLGSSKGEEIPNLSKLIDNVKSGKDLPSTIQQLNDIFSDLPDMDTAEYRTVGWYLALAHIKNGDNDQAKAILQKVIKQCPDFKEAWELRDKLSRTFFWQ